jgi:acetyl esterase/lipase
VPAGCVFIDTCEARGPCRVPSRDRSSALGGTAVPTEDVDYAVRLSCVGVPTELQVYPGVIHGGFVARPGTRRTRQFLADAHETLATAFE